MTVAVAAKILRIELATTAIIGGQILNLYLCLGLPWFIKNVTSGPILISGHHFHRAIYATLSVLAIIMFIMFVNRFKMNYYMGVELILVYVGFCTYEYIKLN